MISIKRIPFHGSDVLVVDQQGRPHIVLKPAVEHIGVDYSRQRQKLKGKSWAVMGVAPTTGADGKTYEMVTVDVRTFLMMLATIDERRVNDQARPILIAYQSEIADVIEAYWTKGYAENPRTVAPYEAISFSWKELAAVIRQRHHLDLSVIHLTRTLRSAGVLLQDGSPRSEYKDSFRFSGSAWLINPNHVARMAAKVYRELTELEASGFVQPGLTAVGSAVTQLEIGGDS